MTALTTPNEEPGDPVTQVAGNTLLNDARRRFRQVGCLLLLLLPVGVVCYAWRLGVKAVQDSEVTDMARRFAVEQAVFRRHFGARPTWSDEVRGAIHQQQGRAEVMLPLLGDPSPGALRARAERFEGSWVLVEVILEVGDQSFYLLHDPRLGDEAEKDVIVQSGAAWRILARKAPFSNPEAP